MKQRKLVVTPKDGGKSVSREALGGLVIAIGINLKKYGPDIKSRSKQDKVEAAVFDRKKKRVDVKAGVSGGGRNPLLFS